MENVNVNATVANDDEPRSKIIFNYAIAKELIRRGFQVIDIKRNRENNEVIFVMRDSLEFRDAMQDIVKERRRNRAERLKAETTEGESEEITKPEMED